MMVAQLTYCESLRDIEARLRVTAFFGTSEKAAKTGLWIALSILVAIVRKWMKLNTTLYQT